MRIVVEGLEEALRVLNDPELIGGPLRDFFTRSVITIDNQAKARAPVDTGRLRSSMGYEVDSNPIPEWGKAGTNVWYAPSQEFGTGRMSDGSFGSGSTHWPPAAALDTWASRHGFRSGKQVARIIGMRGGLLPKRFLREAMAASMGAIEGYLKQLADEIGERWSRG
jgi:hypothetical protein